MWPSVLLFTAGIEADIGEGDLRLQGKGKFFGAFSLYFACLFGHRSGVHVNMTEAMVRTAAQSGSESNGYAIQVSNYSVHHKWLQIRGTVEHC